MKARTISALSSLDRALVIQVSPENIADPLSFQRISER